MNTGRRELKQGNLRILVFGPPEVVEAANVAVSFHNHNKDSKAAREALVSSIGGMGWRKSSSGSTTWEKVHGKGANQGLEVTVYG